MADGSSSAFFFIVVEKLNLSLSLAVVIVSSSLVDRIGLDFRVRRVRKRVTTSEGEQKIGNF